MIEGMLRDLALKVETAKVREVEEEKGSSFTLEKDDNEGEDADDEDQMNILLKYTLSNKS